MGNAGIGWGWIKASLVGLAGKSGFGKGVVDFQDRGFGFVFAVVFGFVLTADNGEGVEDVSGVVAVDAVEVEEGGVEFATEQEPPRLVPAERRPVVSTVPRERLQVPRRVAQLQNSRQDELLKRTF